jgi:hypothetical protein
MELHPSARTTNSLAGQELSRVLCNPNDYYRVQKAWPRPCVTIHNSLISSR